MEDQRGKQPQCTQGPAWPPAAQTLCPHGCTRPAPRAPRPFPAYRGSLRHFFPVQKPESTSPLRTPFSLRIPPPSWRVAELSALGGAPVSTDSIFHWHHGTIRPQPQDEGAAMKYEGSREKWEPKNPIICAISLLFWVFVSLRSFIDYQCHCLLDR